MSWTCPTCNQTWDSKNEASEFWRTELTSPNRRSGLTQKRDLPTPPEIAQYTCAENPCCPKAILKAAESKRLREEARALIRENTPSDRLRPDTRQRLYTEAPTEVLRKIYEPRNTRLPNRGRPVGDFGGPNPIWDDDDYLPSFN